MSETVLIVAAHPDDEVLGCGGVMAKHADSGDAVHVLFVADGVGARGGAKAPKGELARRKAAARRAAKILGANAPQFLDFPDNRLDGVDLLDVTKAIEAFAANLKPSIVYTHHGGDLNIDHRLVHQAVVTAFRPLPGAPTRNILAFETLSSTEWATPAIGQAFQPDRFIGIEKQLKRKLGAIDVYRDEMRPFPHPRSPNAVRALAVLRGSAAGLPAAEAFMTVRWVEA